VTAASIIWRCLDTPGHDACRLDRRDGGWRLDGAAVFRHEGAPAWLAYRVACDGAWRALRGEVRGWLGPRPVDIAIGRTAAGHWTINGAAAPGLERCVDLDLAFTPATNLTAIRRLALAVGEAADAPVAWLDVGATALVELPQRYERRAEAAYWYASPSHGYAALLEVTPEGFVRRYPGLWEEAPEGG
jgi:hypothetical protein